MRQLFQKYWWFFLLIAIAVYFFLNHMQSSTIQERHKHFSVENVSEITDIIIKNDSIYFKLEKENGYWLVNQSLPAREESVEAFLYLISNIQTSYPLPISVADSLCKILKESGLNVKVRSRNKTLREYWIHSTSTLSLGGIGMLKNSKYAFQLRVLNYNDDVVQLFVTNPSMWIDNEIHLRKLKDAIAVEVEIPKNPEKSYRFDINKEQKRLFALFYGQAASSFDEEKASSFINQFSNITVSTLNKEISSEEKTSIALSQPDFVYKFYFEDDKIYEIKILPIPVEEYLDELGRPVHFDLNSVYVILSDDSSNIYQTKYAHIHPILKDISYFQPKFNH